MLKKVLTPFLLPPGVFIAVLLILGGYLIYKKRWKIASTILGIGCLMWLVSIPPISDPILESLNAGMETPKDPRGDVVIVLAGGGDKAMERIICAARLQKRLKVPVIASGGRVFAHKDAAAPLISEVLMDLGVSLADIVMEDESRDTFETAKNAKEICIRMGYKNPVLVTSPWHLRRAVMSFEKAGLKVIPFPARIRPHKDKKYSWIDFLPGNFVDISRAIYEYLGLVFYKFAY